MDGLQADATALLAQLVRHNTVNPPGNELAAQEELAALLSGAGFEVTLVGSTPERPNLVARLRGKAEGPVLALLSHVDTVLADASEWRARSVVRRRDRRRAVGPRGARHEVADGGRGDRRRLARPRGLAAGARRPARDRRRGRGGRRRRGRDLADARTIPELVRCDMLLNEGGGAVIPFDGGRVYGVCVAEKGVHQFRVTTHGTAGHASNPRLGDNALLKLAPLITAMSDGMPAFDVTEGPRRLLHGPRVRRRRRRDGARGAARARPVPRARRRAGARASPSRRRWSARPRRST